MTAADAYRAGRALADLETRHGPNARREAAYLAGVATAAQLEHDQRAQDALATRLQVRRDPIDPAHTVWLFVPGKGTPADLPDTLHAHHVDPTTHHDAIGPAALSRGAGMSSWRLLDTAAGRHLAALVADDLPVVADLDDEGRLIARVIGKAELTGATNGDRRPRSDHTRERTA